MEKGDFIHINYVGRLKNTGETFDTTNEEVAKSEKIYNQNVKYRPIPVIVGGGFALRGIDEALEKMKVGERRKIEIPPEKGFGERKEDFVKLFPLSVFRTHKIDPIPGRFVTVNNLKGRVVSIDGGRVKVDFNHPLAGKELEYDLEIVDSIIETNEKVKAVVTYYTGLENPDVETKGKDVEITLKKNNLNQRIKQTIADTIFKWIKDFENIKFIDVYSKSEKTNSAKNEVSTK